MNTQEGKESILNISYNKSITIRELLIKEANACRDIYPNIWADFLVQDILLCKSEYIVITYFRYPNEYEVIKKHFSNVKTYRVKRPGIKSISDPSEHQLDHFVFDEIIYNESDVDHLRNIIKSLV